MRVHYDDEMILIVGKRLHLTKFLHLRNTSTFGCLSLFDDDADAAIVLRFLHDRDLNRLRRLRIIISIVSVDD